MGLRITMTGIKASVLVDGKEEVLIDRWFQCRDGLIPQVRQNLYRHYANGHKLDVNEGTLFELKTSNPRVIKWDEILGINYTSPLASPFLLRFYIGRVRNGYQYAALENALRKASDEGVRLPDIATAWNLRNNIEYDASGLGLGNILKTVRGGWNFSEVDHARIFPPSKFI